MKEHTIVRWLLGALVLLSIGHSILYWSIDDTDPIQGTISTEALNSPIFSGEDLLVRITREKVRTCPVFSQRKFVSEDGRTVAAPSVLSLGGPVGADYVDWAYPTPNDLRPGLWELRVWLEYNCGRGNTFPHEQETVRFRVVPKPTERAD